MRRHIFADESGCLTFRRGHNISNYFTLCSIVLDSPESGNALLDLRRELAAEGICSEPFHATTDKQAVRDRVFETIADIDFRVDATILQKSKAQPQTRVNHPTFYKYAWYYHFKYVAPQISVKGDELYITAASLGTNKEKSAFNSAINDVVRQVTKGSYKTAFWQAASDPCLQLADYCAWAIHRKWERGDARSYNLIENKVITEFDLWEKGTEEYY